MKEKENPTLRRFYASADAWCTEICLMRWSIFLVHALFSPLVTVISVKVGVHNHKWTKSLRLDLHPNSCHLRQGQNIDRGRGFLPRSATKDTNLRLPSTSESPQLPLLSRKKNFNKGKAFCCLISEKKIVLPESLPSFA